MVMAAAVKVGAPVAGGEEKEDRAVVTAEGAVAGGATAAFEVEAGSAYWTA